MNDAKIGLNFGKGLQDEGNKAAFLKIDFYELSAVLSNEPSLEKLMVATRVSARRQIRVKQTYKKELLRPNTVKAVLPESKLERALWLRWRLKESREEDLVFLAECPHIISYQVPLYNCRPKKDRDGWGKIDLVGITRDLKPVVIELKASGSKESLLRMVLEAVAYGIALQEAWKPQFLQDWKFALEQLASNDHKLINQESLHGLPERLNPCHILCAAPSEYWKAHYQDRKCGEFTKILDHLSEKGFAVSFADLDFAVRTFEP
jgi:hypothetical protein